MTNSRKAASTHIANQQTMQFDIETPTHTLDAEPTHYIGYYTTDPELEELEIETLQEATGIKLPFFHFG